MSLIVCLHPEPAATMSPKATEVGVARYLKNEKKWRFQSSASASSAANWTPVLEEYEMPSPPKRDLRAASPDDLRVRVSESRFTTYGPLGRHLLPMRSAGSERWSPDQTG